MPQKPAKFRIADAAFARPIVPAALSADASEVAPDIPMEFADWPVGLPVTRSVPPRPRVPTPPPAQPAKSAKPEEPLMTPELSTEELSAAKRETERSLEVVEHNLSLTQGKRLNPAQSDLATQVRGFAESARDAAHNDDWARARNLARKAEVLSQELAGTL